MTSLIHSDTRKWAVLRKLVLRRAMYRCEIQLPGCSELATEVDHIISRMDGGSDELSNLRAACKPCNLRKGAASGSGFFRAAAVPRRQSAENLSLSPITGDYSE